MSIVINKKKVEELMSQGISKDDIRTTLYPELNDSQWKKALKLMGLSIKRVPKIDFVIEDTPENVETVTPSGPQYVGGTQENIPEEGNV
jgi:hypothetical protein